MQCNPVARVVSVEWLHQRLKDPSKLRSKAVGRRSAHALTQIVFNKLQLIDNQRRWQYNSERKGHRGCWLDADDEYDRSTVCICR